MKIILCTHMIRMNGSKASIIFFFFSRGKIYPADFVEKLGIVTCTCIVEDVIQGRKM